LHGFVLADDGEICVVLWERQRINEEDLLTMQV
jgi:hypothetical protein